MTDSNKKYLDRGYGPDIVPATEQDKTWTLKNFFTLWMGGIHNVHGYVMVGGFFALGLSVSQVFFVIMFAAVLVSILMYFTGHAGGKYGIPFAVLLKSSYGVKGSNLPGFLRGVITAIMFFGIQNYAGSAALTILFTKIWPGYIHLGGNFNFFGINLPGLISFILMWCVNVWLVMGGLNVVGRFFNILAPLVYLVFGGTAIWAVVMAGGLGPIFEHAAKMPSASLFVVLTCIAGIMGNWAAPSLSVPDFMRRGHNPKKESIYLGFGILAANLLFALASISIIIGSEIAFGKPIWNVLDVLDHFNSMFAITVSVLVIAMTALAVNTNANLIPAGYQLATIFPKYITFKKGVLIAAIIGFLIMPWNFMNGSEKIMIALAIAGGLLGPVAGVMLAHYFVERKTIINLDNLYPEKGNVGEYPGGYNKLAYIVTIVAAFFCLGGKFIDVMKPLADLSWFVGFIIAFVLYAVIANMNKTKIA